MGKINPKDFVDLIERFNPFGFKKANGETQVFETYRDLYLYTIDQLSLEFPRGYIDLTLFLKDQMQIPFAESDRLVKNWKPLGITTDTLLLKTWEDTPERKNFLRNVLVALHSISGTRFNEDMFLQALRDWDAMQELKKVQRHEAYNDKEDSSE